MPFFYCSAYWLTLVFLMLFFYCSVYWFTFFFNVIFLSWCILINFFFLTLHSLLLYSTPMYFHNVRPADFAKLYSNLKYNSNACTVCCLRPYHDEYTRSRLITEVKHRRASIVLGWGTAWEHLVPQTLFSMLPPYPIVYVLRDTVWNKKILAGQF